MFKRMLALALAVFMVQIAIAADDTYTVNLEKSNMEWHGRKVTGKHNGAINIKSGVLRFNADKLIGGEFEVDMNTIVNIDIEGADMNKKLVDHLKSDDFFSVDSFPVAVFKITEVKSNQVEGSDANYWIKGDLTIKGITNPVEFYAKVDKAGDNVTATAEMTLDRAKWDVRFGSGSFFKGLGDRLIYDDFNMKVNLTAMK